MRNLFKAPVLINAVLFQILWFAAVLGGAQKVLWPAILATAVMFGWQLAGKRRHPNDIKVICAAIVLGLAVDSTWIGLGLMEFNDPRPFTWLSPVWMVFMWAGFALTLNHSMVWLTAHPVLPGLMGLIGGPMAYLAGERLGAVEYLANTLLVSGLLAIAWAISVTILVKIATASKEAGFSVQPGLPK
ncbi:MAG: DUF2878 domain-containing protein [Pseudomonadota bacterium]